MSDGDSAVRMMPASQARSTAYFVAVFSMNDNWSTLLYSK